MMADNVTRRFIIPRPLYRRLRVLAVREHRTLQGQLIAIIERAVEGIEDPGEEDEE